MACVMQAFVAVWCSLTKNGSGNFCSPKLAQNSSMKSRA